MMSNFIHIPKYTMSIKSLIISLIPDRKIKVLRYKYRKIRQKLHPPMSEEYFTRLLTETMRIGKGDTVFIHSSIDFLNIGFSPIRLLAILKNTVGKSGNLLFPAWHFTERAEEYLNNQNNIFDIKRSPSVLSLLSELARRDPEAQRSIHPINSIVAIGANAKEIVSEHEQSVYPCGKQSPYYKMLAYNAKIAGIGVNANFLSFIHCPEDVMNEDFPFQTRSEEVFKGAVRMSDGNTIFVPTLASHINIQKRNIPLYLKKNICKDIFFSFSRRGSDFYIADANKLYDRIIALAKENKTVYNV